MRRPWTLRRRLVLSVVALLSVVSVLIGVISVAALRGSLMEQVDDQLAAATQRSDGAGGERPGGSDIRPELVAVGTISALFVDGTLVDSVYFDETGVRLSLTRAQGEELATVPADGEAHTVNLGELGDYRAIAQSAGGQIGVVVGLPLAGVQSIVLQLVIAIVAVTVVGIALAGLAGALIVRRALRPLDRVAATASRVAELRLDKGEVALAVRVPDEDADARTEVGQVGSAINRMLDHVASALSAREQSESKVRRFVADASHELRTPLTSIRGYAELTRRSGHDLPEDVVRSIGRVESEATRMTSLVEDLLLLARLDEGRDLESAPVDLSRLLIDVVSDAHVAARGHTFEVELPDEPVIVSGDELRLHQVFANLLANASVHTPEGTRVSIALAAGERVETTVTDDGPGIPAELQPQLFERFSRGDSSRSRIAGSTGLGLAIVRAVVEGHGGTVSVDSRPGATRFTVALPRRAE